MLVSLIEISSAWHCIHFIQFNDLKSFFGLASKLSNFWQFSTIFNLLKSFSFSSFRFSIDLWLSHNQIPIRKLVLLFYTSIDSLNAKTMKFFRIKYQTTYIRNPIQNFRMLRFHIFVITWYRLPPQFLQS